MKRFLSLFLILILTICMMFSCKKKEDDSISDQGDGNSAEPDIQENAGNAIYSPSYGSVLVYDEGSATQDSINLIAQKLYVLTDVTPKFRNSSSEIAPHEIVVGYTEREITKKALKYLDRLEPESDTEVRYVIYSDGDSVAIVYDEALLGINAAEEDAVSKFIDDFCTKESLVMSSGVKAEEVVCVIERQQALVEKKIDEAWLKAERQFTELYGADFATESIKALKQLYALYTDGAVSWIANLFDPESGGFYYSNSARNTVGFLPDLESTYQALSFIGNTGMLDEYKLDVKLGLPDWFGERIVGFVKSLQSKENGYFYHPQWTKVMVDSNLARRGRDLSHAVNILNLYGAKPTYDTPSGVEGDGVLADGSKVAAVNSLCHQLSLPVAKAVSKVVAVSDDSTVPAHMRSEAAFRNYLSGLDINGDSYYIGNLLESQANQIVARDRTLEKQEASYRLSDILEKWFNDHQNPITGMWERGSNIDYQAVNGLLKISSTYNRIGKPVPRAALGLQGAIKVLTGEDPIRHVCDILNPWYAIAILTQNMNNYSKDTEALNSVKQELVEKFCDAVQATTQRLSILYRPDGSFGYLPESSADTSQNMPVALPDSYEGDVNATLIAISSIPHHIFGSVGVDYVSPYTSADRLELIHILEGLDAVIKDTVTPAYVIDFEGDEPGEESIDVRTVINSSGSIKVVSDPDGSRNNVLKFTSNSDGAGKGADELYFDVAKDRIGSNCFSFEADMYVSSDTREGTFSQINIGLEAFMINISKKNGKVVIDESSSSNSNNAMIYKIGAIANIDEWFNLRIEYYPGDSESTRIKLHVNNEILVVSDNYYDHQGVKLTGEGNPKTKYTEARIIIFSDVWGTVYLDNISLDKSTDIYSAEHDIDKQPLRNVDAPDSEKIIYGFEDGELPINWKTSGNISVSDTDDGKALFIPAAGSSSIIIPAHARGSGANAALVEATLTVPEDIPVGSKLGIDFCEFGTDGAIMAGVHILVREDSEGKYLSFYDGIGSSTGSDIGEGRIAVGEEFILRIEYFFKSSIIAVYADDNLVGATLASAIGSTSKYFSEIKITNIQSSDSAGMYFDNLCVERVKRDVFKERDSKPHDLTAGLGEVTSSGNLTLTSGGVSFDGAWAGDGITVPVNLRCEVMSSSIFEFSVKHGAGFIDGGEYRITLCDKDGNIILCYDVVAEESKLRIYEVTERGRYTTPVAELDDFSSLRIKYSKKLAVAIVYADGESVATSNISYSDRSLEYKFDYATITSLKDMSSFSVSLVTAEISMQEFEVDLPVINTDNERDVITFENSSSVHLPGAVTRYLVSAGASMSVKELVKAGERTKAISFVTTPGSGDAGKDYFNIYPTVTITSLETCVVEMDIMLTANSSSSYFELEPLSGDTRAYKLTVRTVRGGDVIISGADIPSTPIAKAGEWFKLRLEYTNPGGDMNGDGENDIVFSIFVNDSEKPVAVGYKPYTSKAFRADELTSLRFFMWSDSDMTICIDNVYVGGNDAVIELPEPEPEPDPITPSGPSIGAGGLRDDTAWTD